MTIGEIKFKGASRSSMSFWYECKEPDTNPNFISASGSKYWFYPEYAIRTSDHWGIIKNNVFLIFGKLFSETKEFSGTAKVFYHEIFTHFDQLDMGKVSKLKRDDTAGLEIFSQRVIGFRPSLVLECNKKLEKSYFKSMRRRGKWMSK